MNDLYEELNEEKKTAVSAATSIAQLNWITDQVSGYFFSKLSLKLHVCIIQNCKLKNQHSSRVVGYEK